MGGWIAVWSRDAGPPDQGRWERSLRAALRYGGRASVHVAGRAAIAAWRRDTGEFPRSGTLSRIDGAHAAWAGQCVDDAGDTTERAMQVVASKGFDDRSAAALNGPFAAAILREQPFEIRIVTDRYRHYPVYVHEGASVVIASTEMRCVVPWLERVRLDGDAVDMLLRCGELINRTSMLEGVRVLPPGTVLEDRGQGTSDRRYWSMRHDGVARPFSATAELLASGIKTAVRRLDAVTPRLGVTLSGGLDSRVILDLCKSPERVPSFTWGLEGCRDIACASKFASLVKSPHTVRHWDPGAFPGLWPRGVDLTAGGFGIEGMHMIPFVPLLASACDVVFNGLAGDVVLGGNFLKHSWLQERDIGSLAGVSWRWRVQEDEDALVDRLTGRAPGSAQECWRASITAREGARPVERLNDWLYENRVFRYTNCGTMLLRSGVESHAPFFDRDLMDACLTVHQEDKFKHRLYLEIMRLATPRGASVPWQRTTLPPIRGYRANLAAMALHRAVNVFCKPLGIKPFESLAVADPPGWLRGPWRQMVDEIILSDRALGRGMLNADVVTETWNSHLAGQNRTRQIGGLIAIELFARQTLDGVAPPGSPVPEKAGAAA